MCLCVCFFPLISNSWEESELITHTKKKKTTLTQELEIWSVFFALFLLSFCRFGPHTHTCAPASNKQLLDTFLDEKSGLVGRGGVAERHLIKYGIIRNAG